MAPTLSFAMSLSAGKEGRYPGLKLFSTTSRFSSNLDLGYFNCFFLRLTQDARSRLSPPAPLAIWLQQPPTLLLCWKKVKASLLTTDVHMNVRHLPNKCLPKGGLIIIPRVAIPSLPLTAAALQQLLLGALTLSLWEHVAGPFSDAQNPEAEDSQTCCSGAVLVSDTHAIQAETTHASQFSRSCHIP